jgi:hypothetical protein
MTSTKIATTARRRRLVTVAVALGLAAAPLTTALPTAAAQPSTSTGVEKPARVRVVDYDLGDDASRVPGFHGMDPKGMPTEEEAPLEIIGRVYAPANAAGRHLPLVVLAHGLFWSCADSSARVAADATTQDWPCTGRFHGIHSERGYGYLARSLAARGLVVVSISANGINAGELGEVADRARGVLVYQHLRLLQQLANDGTGPLVGAFTDAATGRSVSPGLRGAIDFRNVGLMGHSRGGRGMMWAAADSHRSRVPEGVRFTAVFGMAAAGPPFMDHGTRRLKVTKVPLMSWIGGCDVTGDDSFNRLASRGDNPVNIAITVHGANHNNLNSRWSAHSGLAGSEDDAQHPKGEPGKCFQWDAEQTQDTLGYHAEQRVARTYVNAFFARYLLGDRSFDDVLSGERKPARDLTQVDVVQY